MEQQVRSFWAWVFARFYVRSVRQYPGAEDPAWVAAMGVSSAMWANGFAIALLVSWILGQPIHWAAHKVLAALSALALLPFNRWWLGDRRFTVELIQRMSHETEAQMRREAVWLWTYVIISWAAPWILGAMLLWPRK